MFEAFNQIILLIHVHLNQKKHDLINLNLYKIQIQKIQFLCFLKPAAFCKNFHIQSYVELIISYVHQPTY